MLSTLPSLKLIEFPAIRREKLMTLQVNLGYRCNQQCLHCHVNAGPSRKEQMDRENIEIVLSFMLAQNIKTLDLTGGAPELNPYFRELVSRARDMGVHVIDRCNLTILSEPGQEGLAEFLAAHDVEVVASMPCYLEENVNAQRGKGVFERSIDGLRQLNELGYAQRASRLQLNLVYNPQGPSLPPPQCRLEQDYRKQLGEQYGIQFNTLYTLANMPIQRFGSLLMSKGQFHDYMSLLCNAHQQANLASVMCRSLLSVDWQGYTYDCDFNQMLDMPLDIGTSARIHLGDLLQTDFESLPIQVAGHCYGCTAGQGSSCGGALSE
jgi:radical SAM/Cys-rich protein